MIEGDANVGISFDTPENANNFCLTPLRAIPFNIPRLRLVGSVGANKMGARVSYRVRFPLVVSFFMLSTCIVPIIVGVVFIEVGRTKADIGLIASGTILPIAILAILFFVAIRLPAIEGIKDEGELIQSLLGVLNGT
jgi:hypothetical protein